MQRPAGTPGEWSAEIESVFSAPDTSDPVFPVYLNITLWVEAYHEAVWSPSTGKLRLYSPRTTVIQQGE